MKKKLLLLNLYIFTTSCGLTRGVFLRNEGYTPPSFQKNKIDPTASSAELTRSYINYFAEDLNTASQKSFKQTKVLSSHMTDLGTTYQTFLAPVFAEASILLAQVPAFPESQDIQDFQKGFASGFITTAQAINSKAVSQDFFSKNVSPLTLSTTVSATISDFNTALDAKLGQRSKATCCGANACSSTQQWLNDRSLSVPIEEISKTVQVEKVVSRSVFARSFQPYNGSYFPFQILFKCSKLTAKLAASPNVQQTLIWPEWAILEKGTTHRSFERIVWVRNVLKAKTVGSTLELSNPGVKFKVTESIVDQYQYSIDLTVNDFDHMESTVQPKRTDSSISGKRFLYFRESLAYFLSKFYAAQVSATQGIHSFASFQNDMNKLFFETTSTRPESSESCGLTSSWTQAFQWFGLTKDNTMFQYFPLTYCPNELKDCVKPQNLPHADFAQHGKHAVDSRTLENTFLTVKANDEESTLLGANLDQVCREILSDS